MNHCVPDFNIQIDDEEENRVLLSNKPSAARNNEIMELLWQNGSVVMHNQSHRQSKKPPSPVTNTGNQVIPDHGEIRSSDVENFNINQHLFMQEDEMASWLFDSINEDPPIINTETLFHSSTGVIPGSSLVQSEQLLPQSIPTASRPPIHPARKEDQVLNRKHNNFAYFANHSNSSIEPSISSSSMIPARRETTMVDSCDTPIMTEMTNTASKLSETIRSTAYTECVSVSTAGKAAAYTGCGTISQVGKAATATTKGVRETSKLDIAMTSSHDCSSGSVDPIQRKLELERKRKGRVSDKSKLQRQEGKKQVRGSTSTKRSRAAEVHNLSERKRRDRINEKMKALQELIPRCNKSDKASMLDEAIEYLKSLQLQVQMMSMGCGMVPMMFPGMQQYMPSMGMRMGMGMGMNRPVMPFSNILHGSPLPPPTTTVATAYGSRFSMPPFHMPQPHVLAVPESSDNPLNSLGTLLPDQSRIPNTNFTDPYQQFLRPHQLQQLIQGMNQQNFNRPGNSGGQGNSEKHQAG